MLSCTKFKAIKHICFCCVYNWTCSSDIIRMQNESLSDKFSLVRYVKQCKNVPHLVSVHMILDIQRWVREREKHLRWHCSGSFRNFKNKSINHPEFFFLYISCSDICMMYQIVAYITYCLNVCLDFSGLRMAICEIILVYPLPLPSW